MREVNHTVDVDRGADACYLLDQRLKWPWQPLSEVDLLYMLHQHSIQTNGCISDDKNKVIDVF